MCTNIMKMVSDLPLSAKCIKYLLFLFNLLFVITGIILISVGATVHGIYNTYNLFLEESYMSTSSFLVAIGLIIFIISFFGCCGAVKENFCMTITFSSLLIIIFIFELSAGISGYVLKDRSREVVSKAFLTQMKSYQNNNETMKTIDLLQLSFDCCGAKNWTDWNQALSEPGIPVSCCGPVYGAINSTNCTPTSDTFFNTPCVDAFGKFISEHAYTIGGCALGLAIIQLLGIVFSCYLSRAIKRNYESV